MNERIGRTGFLALLSSLLVGTKTHQQTSLLVGFLLLLSVLLVLLSPLAVGCLLLLSLSIGFVLLSLSKLPG